MRSRRAVVALALVGLVAGSACAPDDPAIIDPDVRLFSQLVGPEADALVDTLEPFTEATGITVRLVSSTNLERDLIERVQADEPPDVALVPQPGLVDGLASQLGALQPLPPEVLGPVRANFDQRWVDLTTVDGRVYGVYVQASAKSLVWYSPKVFAERGYEVPEDWEGLEALLRAMVDREAGGVVKPWCLGVRDGDASGWVGTDWIEDLVLRPEDPDADGAATYDAWVAGDVEFSDPAIAQAFDDAGAMALRSTLASPPSRRVLSTPVQEAGDGLLGSSPDCLLHRQASFSTAWLPAGTSLGPDGDVDVFPLPDRDGGPAPMVLGGQIAVAFRDRPEVWALLAYLATPEGVAGWARHEGYLAPHRDFPDDGYGSEIDRRIDTMVEEASLLRFDGSDQMPVEVGVGSFWRGMEAFIGGSPSELVRATIDATWPRDDDLLGIEDDVLDTDGAAAVEGVAPSEVDPGLGSPPAAEP